MIEMWGEGLICIALGGGASGFGPHKNNDLLSILVRGYKFVIWQKKKVRELWL